MLAIYGRVSTGRQEKEDTIRTQVGECREKAKELGYSSIAEYLDEDYSGSTFIRPGLDKLRDDCKAGIIHSVMLHVPDRLARKKFLRQLVLEEWQALGVKVIYHHYEVEDSPEGRLLDNVMADFSEYERERILDRTRRAREYAMRQGKVWRTYAPYGYIYQGGDLHLVEDQASVIRQIAAWILAGKTLYWVINTLNAQGVRTNRDKPWVYPLLYRLLKNPILRGEVAFNRYHVTPSNRPRLAYRKGGGGTQREKPRSEWFITERPDLSIISSEDFEAIARQLSRNRCTSTRNSQRVYPASGLLFCPCGRRMEVIRRPSGNYYYRCNRRRIDNDAPCVGKGEGQPIEDTLWTFLLENIGDPRALRHHIDSHAQGLAGRRRDAEAAVALARKHLDDVERKLSRLLDLLLDGEVDRPMLLKKQGELTVARDHLQRELVAALQTLNGLAGEQGCLDDPETFARTVAEYATLAAGASWEDQQAHRRALFHRFLTKVTAHPGYLEVSGLLGHEHLEIINRCPGGEIYNRGLSLLWLVPYP